MVNFLHHCLHTHFFIISIRCKTAMSVIMIINVMAQIQMYTWQLVHVTFFLVNRCYYYYSFLLADIIIANIMIGVGRLTH